jgi:hypothetical protein
MTTTSKENTGTYWLIFAVSLVAMILLLMFADMWFWLALPATGTALVKALRVL